MVGEGAGAGESAGVSYAVVLYLTHMHNRCIHMHMRTTLNIEDKLLKKVQVLTGISEKTALVKAGLEALLALESSKRLAELGGSQRSLKPIPRRRTAVRHGAR